MHQITRRQIIGRALVASAALFTGINRASEQTSGDTALVDEWLNDAMSVRASDSPLKLQRFLEPIYIVLEPISWKPNPSQNTFHEVIVPRGFVTDLASIPRVFWTLLRPDAEYAYAAIVHDYLYWAQDITKDSADHILKMSMEDLEVSRVDITAIFQAVQNFGGPAWKYNQKLKASGEKRILKDFPKTARTRWSDWKKNDVFI